MYYYCKHFFNDIQFFFFTYLLRYFINMSFTTLFTCIIIADDVLALISIDFYRSKYYTYHATAKIYPSYLLYIYILYISTLIMYYCCYYNNASFRSFAEEWQRARAVTVRNVKCRRYNHDLRNVHPSEFDILSTHSRLYLCTWRRTLL